MTDIDNIGLPKWPALLVKGKDVTKKQAAEIIIRTDRSIPNFEYAGNDRDHAKNLSALFGIPEEFDDGVKYPQEPTKAQKEKRTEEMRTRWASMERLEEKIGKLNLEYLQNSWIVSSYIGGPHGWCDWDGNVGNCATNIGKWPSVEAVTKDWTLIAEAFPFLDLECQLCNHEAGYPVENQVNGPVVKFVVKKGTVTVLPQDPSKDTYIVAPRETGIANFMLRLQGGNMCERGISLEDLKAKLEDIYDGKIPQYRRVKPKEAK